jgi:hypothetical protein
MQIKGSTYAIFGIHQEHKHIPQYLVRIACTVQFTSFDVHETYHRSYYHWLSLA